MLAAALAVITLSNIFFVLVPTLVGRTPANPVTWSAITGRAAGCLLFAGAAFVPVVRLRQPRQAQWLAAAGVLLDLDLDEAAGITASRRGSGLTSMRDRARSVGGELRISSAPGAGSMVEATL